MEPKSKFDDLKLLWATPLLVRKFAEAEELNAGLERLIVDLKKVDRGVQRSNYNGWQSTGNLFQYHKPEFEQLHNMFAQVVADCVVEIGNLPSAEVSICLFAWANVLEISGYHTFHTHTNCHFSGVYYVRTGEADPRNPKSGVICFYEPRAGAAMTQISYLGFAEDYEILPEEGMLVLFPAFLGHSVHSFTGEGKRIAIGFNATLIDN